MRVISQDGKIDIPYELSAVTIGNKVDLSEFNINIRSKLLDERPCIVATYSTEAKAKKAMEFLQNTYYEHEAEKIYKEGVGYIHPYFRFPKDEEVEVLPMERLTNCDMYFDDTDKRLFYNKLKEYEDLEEKGLLLKLPCKVGDTVYLITSDGKVAPRTADMMFLGVLWDEYGKEWFLTQEEAEEKLKESGGSNGS